jgi:nucleoside-diphosphate-sugar epimerase
MRILITGSEGFIGSKLCSKIETQGFDMVKLDHIIGHDITNPETFENITTPSVIVHLASLSYVPDSFKNPYQFYQQNFLGTLNVLEFARKHKAKVIFFSSYLYGRPDQLPVNESHELNPHNPYAESKRIGEILCEAYQRDFGVNTIIFRPFNIYGPGQNSNFLIPTIIKQIKAGNVHLMDATPKRDYIHVDDIVNAVLKAITNSQVHNEILNLGSGKSYSVDEIVQVIKSFSPIEFNVSYEDNARKNEVPDCYADISKTQVLLNWNPEINIHDGIKTLIEELK